MGSIEFKSDYVEIVQWIYGFMNQKRFILLAV